MHVESSARSHPAAQSPMLAPGTDSCQWKSRRREIAISSACGHTARINAALHAPVDHNGSAVLTFQTCTTMMTRILTLIAAALLASTRLVAANVTIDGVQTYQTIDGFGVDVNTGWWNGGEVTPAIGLLVDQLGATLFRAVIEEMDWEATNDDADPNTFNGCAADPMYCYTGGITR